MQCLTTRMDGTPPTLTERADPTLAADSDAVVVRTLRVGIDGTDHAVVAGAHGDPPAGRDQLILGHEAVGVTETPHPQLPAGSVVTPLVRRPRDAAGPDRLDMASPAAVHECGIDGADGFACERFVADVRYLVAIPAELAPAGILIEPLSVAHKAIDLAMAARQTVPWEPAHAVVIGNGSLGLLCTLALQLDPRVGRVSCMGRRDRPDPTIAVIERLGAHYLDTRRTPVPALADAPQRPALIIEATGHAPHAFETITALAHGGVGALLGVPGDDMRSLDAGRLHRDMVVGNKALIGSVNSGRPAYLQAVETLAAAPSWFADAMIDRVLPHSEAPAAFSDDDTTIKTAIEFAAYEER